MPEAKAATDRFKDDELFQRGVSLFGPLAARLAAEELGVAAVLRDEQVFGQGIEEAVEGELFGAVVTLRAGERTSTISAGFS